ncbi:MAG: biotin/lipoyl-containing protein [Candidatus Scalindua sp.]|jgi:pyruvate dehydrogenase E2 component (dihydrolipoamide acetyltransferase)|nr:biotin/lipoyl-containing protein [Candidatus Scalindua sp.]MDV5165709.1 biotin/lipoyl-containing protein [Candidatus Scalindua sp.]
MQKEFELPDIGIDTDDEITVSFWHMEDDEEFVKDEDLLEVSTNKVNLKIAAPSTGKLIEILAQEGDVVTVGDVIALIEIINE